VITYDRQVADDIDVTGLAWFADRGNCNPANDEVRGRRVPQEIDDLTAERVKGLRRPARHDLEGSIGRTTRRTTR